MKLQSWDALGIDQRKATAFVVGVAVVFFVIVLLVGDELRVGSVSIVLGVIAAGGAAYLVATTPQRIVRIAAFRQTVEAPPFAAASNIYLRSTGSRSKTLLMLRAEEPRLRSFLAEVRRRTLLGYDAPSAIEASGPQNSVFSESTRTVVDSVVGVDRTRIEEGSDELDGILNSASLEEETKLPLFIAVSFFLPIMLMLFAAISKETGPAAIGALVVLEVIILDLAFTVSGTSASWRRA